jgi:hypothetical protein
MHTNPGLPRRPRSLFSHLATTGLSSRQWERLIQHYESQHPAYPDPADPSEQIAAASIVFGKRRQSPLPESFLREAIRSATYRASPTKETPQ